MKDVIVFGLSNSIGGVENYLINMQEQVEDRVRFIFFIEDSQNMYAERIAAHHGEVVFIPRQNGLLEYLKLMYHKLREYRIRTNVLYLNISNYSHELFATFQMAKKLQYQIIVHSHGAMLQPIKSALHRGTHKIVKQMCLKCVDRYFRIAVSQRAGRFMYGNKTFNVLYPGIDMKRYCFNQEIREEIRNKYDCKDRFVVGFVGRMVEVKNPGFAIRVFSEACKMVGKEHLMFLMIGDGPILEEAKQQAKSLCIEKEVCFLGASDQVQRFLQAMDCFIGTSLSEGMPLGMMEAQAAGLPCVCAEGRYPHELAVTDKFHMLPLEAGENAWAETIIELMKEQKYNREKWLQDHETDLAVFDQQYTANKLYEYIMKLEDTTS